MQITDKLLRLRDLISEAGHNYYERIKLASEILTDAVWVTETYNGDQFKAAEMLESQFFHDLCGVLSIFELMHIYQKFPAEADWKRHKYNLGAMHEMCELATKPSVTVTRFKIKKSEYEALVVRLKDIEFELKEAKRTNRQLRSQIDILITENEILKDQLEPVT